VGNRRTLIQGGAILSMDPRIGDLSKGDVLIEARPLSRLRRR
jgi:hypothetical protein